jgi:conjugative relaxase-like TrwC/TraI family protein
MLTITKFGIGTAREYFQKEFANASNSYFSEKGVIQGRWSGSLAEDLGLSGAVTEEAYLRLIEGQDPKTGEQWIQHRDTYLTREGKEAGHIPAWDLTLSAPKSFSLAALVGEDERLVRAAQLANAKAMDVMEGYVQARGGGNRLPINTGSWILATFQHDTSRPVDGYPAPQLHFHNVLMNVQREFTAQFRALQSAELFKAKSLGTAVFYSELQRQAHELGYETRIDPNTKAPEIKSFSQEYLAAESLRRQEIVERLNELGLAGSNRAAQIAALTSREDKLKLTPDELRALHQAHGEIYGNQAQRAHSEALERGSVRARHVASPASAVDFAERRLSERNAVFEHYELVRDALRYGRGGVDVDSVEGEIRKRIREERLIPIHHYRDFAPGARYTTPEMIRLEREVLERVGAGVGSVSPIAEYADLSRYPQVADNPKRQEILRGILATQDQFVALQGTAGSAKSTAAGIVREIAEEHGFRVKGLAPTGKARDALQEKGISSETLQLHLIRARGEDQAAQANTLYILDEASLASTKQMRAFLNTLGRNDHVLLIGDDDPNPRKVGQHKGIEAGRLFQELQEAGMKTAHLNRVYRQKEPELKQVVLEFRHGRTERALALLARQQRVNEYANMRERYGAIANAYVEQPKGTLVVSPDNQSREDLNSAIRSRMREAGLLHQNAHEFVTLVPRDVSGMDRTQADSYRIGDTIRFLRASRRLAVEGKSYAQVIDSDTAQNRLTIRTEDGRTLTYDPRQAAGVSVYESKVQPFAVGDRVQLTANSTALGVSTRDIGTITKLDANGNIQVQIDKGRKVRWNLADHRHIDYAYAMTSYSAQGTTVDRVLLHINTSDYRLSGLIDKTLAYVGTSRAQHDIQIFADDASRLDRSLSRETERAKALSPDEIRAYRKEERSIAYV